MKFPAFATSIALSAALGNPMLASSESVPEGNAASSSVSAQVRHTEDALQATEDVRAEDVALRMGSDGGLAPELVAALSVPSFSMFGDGTVIYRRSTEDGLGVSLWTTRLPHDMVEKLLGDAIEALAPFGDHHDASGGPGDDASTIEFTLNTGVIQARITLRDDIDGSGRGQAAVDLASRLGDVDSWLADATVATPYSPRAYSASFVEEDPDLADVVPWPWSDVPFDELASSPIGSFMLTAELRPDQVAVLIDEPSGPRSDIVLATSDGRAYRLLLRPLLPDEVTTGAEPAD